MSDTEETSAERDGEPTGLIRAGEDITAESVGAAEGMQKAVLLNDDYGTDDVAIRRFTLDPGASVPRHTNAVEHAQYVLDGSYVVGIEGMDGDDDGVIADGDDASDAAGEGGSDERRVAAGDAVHVPAGAVHWYRNDGDEQAAFLCAVPTGDDEIRLAE